MHQNCEILVAAPGTTVEWVPASHGNHGNVGPMSAEGFFVGRAFTPDKKFESGKIHPSGKKCIIPWGGKEQDHAEYETLWIREPTHRWVAWTGMIPGNAVHASDSYVVVRGFHDNDWVPGKLHTTEHKCYIPWEGKELPITGNIELLVHAPNAKVEWVFEKNGQVPQGAVGPMGKGYFVGRATCPHPESKPTPGKICPSMKKMWICWGGKDIEHHDYEALVIKY